LVGEWDRDAERRCLHALAEGADRWNEFRDMFWGFLATQLQAAGVKRYQDREDIYHDVVLKLLWDDRRILRRFLDSESGLPFVAYLKLTLRSAVIDAWRRAKLWRKVQLKASLELIQPIASGTEEPELREARLCLMFQGLACQMRDLSVYKVLHWRYIGEVKTTVIADRLNISHSAVSRRLKTYHRKLRSGYGHELAELAV
jgi:RNA polymerase sigma factor (sigma-70 family)